MQSRIDDEKIVCRLCLLITRANAIPAASHFTALSLFNSYVIAHERTALEDLYIVSARIRGSYPSYFRENWKNQIHNLLLSLLRILQSQRSRDIDVVLRFQGSFHAPCDSKA